MSSTGGSMMLAIEIQSDTEMFSPWTMIAYSIN